MADTDTDQQQPTTTQDTGLRDQARAAFGSIFSADNLIPLDQVKRLGVYTPEERPQLVQLFDDLTKLIDSKYQLIDNQEIIIKLLSQGVVKLTTEGKKQFGNTGEIERPKLLFLPDWAQIITDISRLFWSWDHSPHLIFFESMDPQYWLKRLGKETAGRISSIFSDTDIEEFRKGIIVPTSAAIAEHAAVSTPSDSATSALASDVSSAKVDGEAISAAVTAYSAGSSDQSDAGEGQDQSEPTDSQQLETSEDFQKFLQSHTREFQIERQNLLSMLEFEFYNNIRGDHASAELDQIWSDLAANFNEELYHFLISHPTRTQQLLSGEDGKLRLTIFGQFIHTIGTTPKLVAGITHLYTELGDELAAVSPVRAEEFAEKLAKLEIDNLSLAEIIGELPKQEVVSAIKQHAVIEAIPKERPEQVVTQTTSESELQKTAAEYLATHAEYEIFRKTRIFLYKLSPELDLSAQNIRRDLAEFARREILNLTDTQLRLAQSDPTYLLSLYQRFAINLPSQYPQITSFLIEYGRFIQQTDATEAAQFEAVYRNGILGRSVGAKDALAADLQASLGGGATPIVVANTAATIDAMILEFGDAAPEFVKKISANRLELAFGLAAGTLTAATAPIFIATLQSQISLRLSDLKMGGGQQFLQSGGLQGAIPSDPASVQRALSAIPQSRQMLTSFGAETTIAALTTPVTPVEKNHAAWWSSLPKDVQSQLYDKIEGVGSSSQFAGFSSLPIPPKLNTYNSTEIRKFLVGIGTENIHVIDPILDIQDRIAIQQVKVAKLREQVLAEVIQNIKDEQAAMIAAQMGLAVAEGESNQNAIQIAMTSGAAPLAITQLAGMNVGTDPYTYDYGQGSSSAKSQIASSIRSALMKKAGKALAGKFAQGAALKAGLAATGVGVVPAAALAIWQNKTLRQIALAGGALAVGKTLYALTTVGGAAGGAIGAFLGAALGPVGAVAGGMIGANVGAAIPGLGGQWTGLMGWTPHAPISPFGTAGSSLSSGSGAGQSMSAMRAANTGATQPLSYSQQTALTSAPETSAVAGDAFAQASPTTTAAGSSSLTGFLGATAAAVTATAAPLIGIGIGLFLSIQVLFIIYSAFLIKVPSEGVVGKTEELSKYATLEKTASPESIDDSVSPISTDVTYAIKFEPKKEYRLQVTQVKDAFSYQGCDKKQEHSCDLSLKSPLTLNSFPPEIMTGPAEPTYSLTISAVDVMVINTLTITFDVFDTAGNKLSTNETITALAAVVIGNPTIGCFTPGTAGINLGTEKDPYITITTTDADMSKVRAAYSASILENPKFTSLVCAKGPITIYRLASNASGYYGWTTSSDSIALYTPTFSSTISTEYTLIHELGHIVDNRNAGLRATFVATLPSNLYSCFNYPFPDRCADGEAFAEAIARYVTNYRVYNLKQVHPKEHAWLKNNVFGGVEY